MSIMWDVITSVRISNNFSLGSFGKNFGQLNARNK